MIIKTKALGKVDIDESNILTFVGRGIIGFQDLTRFILLRHQENSPFHWLQSLDEEGLAFVVIPPEEFKYGYRLEISEADLNVLGLDRVEDAVSLVIVVILDSPQEMTANLQGPIVINPKNKKAIQTISLVPEYHTRHKVLDEMKELAVHINESEGSREGL